MTGAGAPRPTQASCPQCGTQVERGKHVLCPECGFPLNWVDPDPPEAGQSVAGMAHTPDETGETILPSPPPPPDTTAPPPPPPHTGPDDRVPMVACPVCHTPNPRTRTFCQQCGTQLAAPPPPPPPPARPRRPRSPLPLPRSGRGWLVVLAAIVLPVAAFFGTTRLLSKEEPKVDPAPVTTVAATRPPGRPKCPSRIVEPQPGTPLRLAPLNAIREHEGWSDKFVIPRPHDINIRTWRASNGQRQWYVKAYQEHDQQKRGRWLVGQEPEAQPRVLASAAYDTRGYRASDWKVAGQEAPTGVAGCLTGT